MFAKFVPVLTAFAICGTLLAGVSTAPANAASAKTLTAFHSDAELRKWLKREARRRTPPPPPAPPPPPPPAMAPNASAESDSVQPVVVTGSVASKSESITNNQEANVDEGDIVKRSGDFLVVLHRGRLFTVSTAKAKLKAIASIAAYPPGVDARADWYDEMLVSGNRVVVIGYSYGRGGTEINRFHLDSEGHLAFEDAYQLHSNDYYSSRNYASRLVGTRLIFYTPRYLPWGDEAPFDAFPGLRKWAGQKSGDASGFRRIASAQRVYYARQSVDMEIDAIHSVTVCDLAARTMACRATSVLGAEGRNFYVSGHAVYVWVSQYERAGLLYRLPLDGSAPSAIGVHGAPVDQFSFREDRDVLNVLIRAEGKGDAMWNPEYSHGAIGLLRLPLASFGDGSAEAARRAYRRLPTPKDTGDFHNRFVGDYVLYGNGNGWGPQSDSAASLTVARLTGGFTNLKLGHPVDRIEVMGPNAIVIGSDSKGTSFSAIELSGTPRAGDRYVLADASEGESRSHGFFFRPDTADGDGVLGLPVARAARPRVAQLFEYSAGMVYVRRANAKFHLLGALDSHSDGAVNDDCVASCVDWYGNARPIFFANRAFALMGYELIEGRVTDTSVTEIDRVNFAPHAPRATD